MKATKVCPSCKFSDCDDQASECEMCGCDFKMGRKPRARKVRPLALPVPEEVPLINLPGAPPDCPTPRKKADFAEVTVLFDPSWDVFLPVPWLHEYDGGAMAGWVSRVLTRFKEEFGVQVAPWALCKLAQLSPNDKLRGIATDLKSQYRHPSEKGGVLHFVGLFVSNNVEAARAASRRLLEIPQARALAVARAKEKFGDKT